MNVLEEISGTFSGITIKMYQCKKVQRFYFMKLVLILRTKGRLKYKGEDLAATSPTPTKPLDKVLFVSTLI